MKSSVRIAVSSALLAAGGLVALPALATTATPDSGNGELVLYVYNATNDTTYVRGLGVTEDQLLTQSQIASAGLPSTGGTTQIVNASIGNLPHDANLTTFLASAGGVFTYSIIGGDKLFNGSAGFNDAGELRYTMTSPTAYAGGDGPTNSNLNGGFGNLQAVTQVPANSAISASNPSSVVGDKASGIGAAGGIFSPNIAPNPQNTWGVGVNPLANVGDTVSLYMFATNGGTTGANGTNSSRAYIFRFADVTLSATGDLTSAGGGTGAVPLPAAVWLLGSGLVGLAGVGRRRGQKVAA